MILIADSGSTKTHWVLLKDKLVKQEVMTTGINPFITTKSELKRILEIDLLSSLVSTEIDQVVFYGSGCSTDESKRFISQSIQSIFGNCKSIIIEHDLLGAARATCLNKAGISIILGTGSNSCLFDGNQITEHVNSLGFILGDEGSGSSIGKKWLVGYLYGTAPQELIHEFNAEFNLSINDIFNNVYKAPAANAYLASYTKFIHKNIFHPFMEELVKSCFHDFFVNHVSKYSNFKNQPINAVGSVAFYFQKQLEAVAIDFQCKIESISKEPISGLINYHQSWKE